MLIIVTNPIPCSNDNTSGIEWWLRWKCIRHMTCYCWYNWCIRCFSVIDRSSTTCINISPIRSYYCISQRKWWRGKGWYSIMIWQVTIVVYLYIQMMGLYVIETINILTYIYSIVWLVIENKRYWQVNVCWVIIIWTK